MAVVSVKEDWKGQRGTNSADGSATYTRVFLVLTNDPTDGPALVMNRPEIPNAREIYQFGTEIDDTAFCDSLSAERINEDEARILWRVTANYKSESKQPSTNNGQPELDPTLWHDDITYDTSTYSVVAEKAKYLGGYTGITADKFTVGNTHPVVNSAQVPFNPPLEEEETIHIYRITKYSKTLPGGWLGIYQNAINSDRFTIDKTLFYGFSVNFEPYTVKFSSSSQFNYDQGINLSYWRTTMILEHKPKGWRIEVLDKGTHAVVRAGDPDGEGGTYSSADIPPRGKPPLRRLVDKEGFPLTEAVPFDGDGHPLPEPVKPEDYVYIKYSTYTEWVFGTDLKRAIEQTGFGISVS